MMSIKNRARSQRALKNYRPARAMPRLPGKQDGLL
jgi:hypothetical protein